MTICCEAIFPGLVRAANTGITAVVDPRGRVVARTELFERTAIVEDVALLAGDTFYSGHGDLFAWACLAGAALALAATFFSHAREEHGDRGGRDIGRGVPGRVSATPTGPGSAAG